MLFEIRYTRLRHLRLKHHNPSFAGKRNYNHILSKREGWIHETSSWFKRSRLFIRTRIQVAFTTAPIQDVLLVCYLRVGSSINAPQNDGNNKYLNNIYIPVYISKLHANVSNPRRQRDSTAWQGYSVVRTYRIRSKRVTFMLPAGLILPNTFMNMNW